MIISQAAPFNRKEVDSSKRMAAEFISFKLNQRSIQRKDVYHETNKT